MYIGEKTFSNYEFEIKKFGKYLYSYDNGKKSELVLDKTCIFSIFVWENKYSVRLTLRVALFGCTYKKRNLAD